MCRKASDHDQYSKDHWRDHDRKPFCTCEGGRGSGGTLCLSYQEKPLVMDQTLLQQGIAGAVALSCTYMATDVSELEYMNGLVEGSIYRKQSFF
jgi:hypothetical protein